MVSRGGPVSTAVRVRHALGGQEPASDEGGQGKGKQ